uniref:Peptidase M14 domain-containing protein n=1 Tax=Ciona savignyi TaxID=51511 RepID=H2ZHG4_CIOSA
MKFVIVFALLALASGKRFFNEDQVLRVSPTGYQLQVIEELVQRFPAIDYWTEPQGIRPVDIHVPKEHVAAVKVFLTRNRIDYEIFIEDLQTAIENERSPRPEQMSLATFDYNVYHTLDEINQWMSDMVATYSFISQVNVGSSYEGRVINALKLTRGISQKPQFVIDCGLHSREWVAPASCLQALAEAPAGSAEYNILNAIEIYVIPIANPDGYVYTWSDVMSVHDRMWRKTRSDNGKFCLGVDPNRNWDINWSGPGADSGACSDAYYGPSAFSEIEVLSQKNFIASLGRVQAYIDVHAYSQYWMYPYAWTSSVTADDALLEQIATDSVNAIYSVHQQSYQAGPISKVIYVASGSSADYVYNMGVKCSFAAELRDTGRYGFTLPERFIQPTAEETFAGLMVIADAVAGNQC